MLQRPIPWAVALNQPKLGKVWVKFGTSLGKVWNFFGGKLGTSLGENLELLWGKVWNLFGEKFGTCLGKSLEPGLFLVKGLEPCWGILSTLWNSEGTSLASLGKRREFNFDQEKICGISSASKLLAYKYYTPTTNTP